jgi:hypothetical protein
MHHGLTVAFSLWHSGSDERPAYHEDPILDPNTANHASCPWYNRTASRRRTYEGLRSLRCRPRA